MPEGDSLRRAAARLAPLAGCRVRVEAPHRRAQVLLIAERLDGLRLETVSAAGKNLLLTFEGGLVLRSHLRMSGRWELRPAGDEIRGRPWLMLRGETAVAVLWNGPELQLSRGLPDAVRRLGPDILDEQPDLTTMVSKLRRNAARALGDALVDQRVVAGIGNYWKAEGLWHARLSPWLAVAETSGEELLALLGNTAAAMRAAVGGQRPGRRVYGRAGRPCPRCGAAIRSRGQRDDNRTAYWCPGCQRGTTAPAA